MHVQHGIFSLAGWLAGSTDGAEPEPSPDIWSMATPTWDKLCRTGARGSSVSNGIVAGSEEFFCLSLFFSDGNKTRGLCGYLVGLPPGLRLSFSHRPPPLLPSSPFVDGIDG